MDLTFNCHGNLKQLECVKAWLDDSISDIVYGGSKGSGKSYLGCSLIFADALMYPGTNYFIARKKLNDLRKHTTGTVEEVFKSWGLSKEYYTFNATDNFYTLYNGSKVFFIELAYLPSDANYSRFGSLQMTRGWIEEAGEIDRGAFEAISATVGRWKNDIYNLVPKVLQTCNPAKNYLYEYYKAARDGLLDVWKKFIQALPTDNKKLPPGYLQHLERTLSKVEKLRLLFGQWEYDDDPDVIPQYENIINLFTNNFIVDDGKRYITADIARFGSDLLVILLWHGLRVEKILTRATSAINEVVEIIEKLAKDSRVVRSNIIIDDDGVGGGVADYLKGCTRFVNNAKALLDENYQNLATQCGYYLADYINDNKFYINCDKSEYKEKIIQELEQIKRINSDGIGKKQLLSKDEIKKIIGRSPDFMDALKMRMIKEIKKTVNVNKAVILNTRPRLILK